jgi:hypothetical protein
VSDCGRRGRGAEPLRAKRVPKQRTYPTRLRNVLLIVLPVKAI